MCHRTLPIAAALRLLGLTILLTLLSLLGSPVPVVHAQSSDGLVGYWPFDEGSGTSSADRSGNGNTATLSTGASFTPEAAPVPLNNAAALTVRAGGQATATSNGLDNLQQLTIAAWVRQTDYQSVQRYVTLGDENAVLRHDAGLHFYLKLNGRLVGERLTTAIPLGGYHHVAGTYDGAMLRVYLDGNLVGSEVVSGTLDSGSGLRFSSSAEPLHGELDEVRIYNRALTPSAIRGMAFNCGAVAPIPLAECQALVALYASTNVDQWLDNKNWLRNNTPCDWVGITCTDDSVSGLDLSFNNLSGTIPPELGNLSHLQKLRLDSNQLSGPIPPELANPLNLQELRLDNNQLSGGIPPELGNLPNLQTLSLYNNHLSGIIPPELANLTRLQDLWLESNQLRGSISATLCQLPLTYLTWGYNKLLAADPCLTEKDPEDPASMTTQTVPPTAVQAQAFANQQIQLTWTPITYTADGGYYTVLAGIAAGGPYTVVAQTADKTAAGITLAPFGPGTHYLIVRSFTPRHGDQQNDLLSDDSAEVMVVFNTPPVAASATWTVTQGSPLALHLNASDVDPDPLNYAVVNLPSHGALSGAAPHLSYTPAAGFTGEDSFTFKANDGQADSNLATITLHVVATPPVNTPPVAHSQSLTTTQAVAIQILLTATDGEADPLTYQVLTPPAHGVLGGVAPAVIYTPTTGYTGNDSFTFHVSDGRLNSAPVMVQINVTSQPNRLPTAQDDAFTVTRNSQANLLAVLTNDQDADGDRLTLVAVASPLNGAAQLVNGQLRYTPAADFVGLDRFTYTVSDGKSSTVATVNVTVTAPVGGTNSQALYLPLVQR